MTAPFFSARLVPLLLAAACVLATPGRAAVPYPTVTAVTTDPVEGSEVREGGAITVRATVTDATSAVVGAQLLTATGELITGIGSFGPLQPVSPGRADYLLTFTLPDNYTSRVGPENRLGLNIDAENVDPDTGIAYIRQSGTFGRFKVIPRESPALTDLAVSVVDSPDTIPLGDLIAYTATVNNLGPAAATNVKLTFIKDGKTSFVPAGSSPGITLVGNSLTVPVGDLPVFGRKELTIVVRGDQAGVLTVGASVSGDQTDPISSNSILTTTSEVLPAPVVGRPDLKLTLPESDGFAITSSADPASGREIVRVAATVIPTNAGNVDAAPFLGSIVLSLSPEYAAAALLKNPLTGQPFRADIAYADFARINGVAATSLPAGASFDPFTGAIELDGELYRQILAAPAPVYAYAVADLDNALAESNEGNNSVRLGTLALPTTPEPPPVPPAPFTVRVTGISEGEILLPNVKTTAKAAVNANPDAAGAFVTQVQFFVDGEPRTLDDASPYKQKLDFRAGDAREHTISATATDNLGRVANSASVTFRVAAAGAGGLAFDTLVDARKGVAAPGDLVTYTFVVSNPGQSFVATGVTVNAKIPREALYNGARLVDANGNKIRINNPAGKNPLVAENKKSVSFYLGDIPQKESRRAELTVRVPYNARENGPAISFSDVQVTAKGFGGQPVNGSFGELPVNIAGAAPADAPRLFVLKTLTDRETDPEDSVNEVDDATFGRLPSLSYGEKATVLLLTSNYGGAVAEKITVKDRLPDGFEFVEGSARVNDTAASALVAVKGQTITFTLGNYQPKEVAGLTYQMRVKSRAEGGPEIGAVVDSSGANIKTLSLTGSVDAIPEVLRIKIAKVPLVVEARSLPAKAIVGQPLRYFLDYGNSSSKNLKGVEVRALLPAGVSFVSASNENPLPGPDGRTVIFNVGDLPAGGQGQRYIDVTVTEASRAEVASGSIFQAQINDSKYYPPQPFAREGVVRRAKPAGALSLTSDRNAVSASGVLQIGLLKTAPQSVRPGQTFQYTLTAINYSDVRAGNCFVQMFIPDGAEYVSSTAGLIRTFATREFVAGLPLVEAHGAKSFTVTLRATGAVGEAIVDRTALVTATTKLSLQAEEIDGLLLNFPVYCPPSATLIIDGDASLPDNQVAIARAQFDAVGSDGGLALADPQVRERIRTITSQSASFLVGGPDYLQLTNGALLIPTGNGQIVGVGAASLIGTDAASLIGTDGATIVAAGGGNLIQFNNLIGQDGSSLIGQDGNSLIARMVAAGGGNIVAAGGGNIVAAGGGNIVAAGGGNFNANLGGVPVGSVAALVSPGGGNIVAAGGGNLVNSLGASIVAAGGGNAIAANAASIVAAGGGNLIAAGGGGLVTANGAGFTRQTDGKSRQAAYGGLTGVISRDVSRAAAITANGTFIIGGGGNR